jgi:hypothetical protein
MVSVGIGVEGYLLLAHGVFHRRHHQHYRSQLIDGAIASFWSSLHMYSVLEGLFLSRRTFPCFYQNTSLDKLMDSFAS